MMSFIYSGISMLVGVIIGYGLLYLLARPMRFSIQELNHYLVISCITTIIFATYQITKSMLGLSGMWNEMPNKMDVDMFRLIIDSTIIYFVSGLLWELYISRK